MQLAMGVPLPRSTQCELAAAAADAIGPVYRAVLEHAAQSRVLYNDDTPMKIVGLEPDEKTGRKGVFTTGIITR